MAHPHEHEHCSSQNAERPGKACCGGCRSRQEHEHEHRNEASLRGEHEKGEASNE
ncbi:hypothetical protein [Paenibacillus sp. y28]|uniref:hypothetical protein n=1 Tax=Paenibacillus sp. y28 TaxID=3129110 RepID=UPI0030191C69